MIQIEALARVGCGAEPLKDSASWAPYDSFREASQIIVATALGYGIGGVLLASGASRRVRRVPL